MAKNHLNGRVPSTFHKEGWSQISLDCSSNYHLYGGTRQSQEHCKMSPLSFRLTLRLTYRLVERVLYVAGMLGRNGICMFFMTSVHA